MNKEHFSKIKKITSFCISIVFWLAIITNAVALLGITAETSIFENTDLEEVMIFRQKMAVFLWVMCLLSVFLNKKILMLVWAAALIYVNSFYTVFSKYNQYREHETCLDLGRVWDGEQRICRTDCVTWNKEQGCVKE